MSRLNSDCGAKSEAPPILSTVVFVDVVFVDGVCIEVAWFDGVRIEGGRIEMSQRESQYASASPPEISATIPPIIRPSQIPDIDESDSSAS